MDLLPVLRAVHIGSMVLLGGTWAFRLLLVPQGVGAGMERALRTLGAHAAIVALASWVGWLAAVAIDMSGLPPSGALAPQVLDTVAMQTTFGHVWLWRAGLLLVVAALQWHATRSSSRAVDWLAALLAACALGSLAASGHALGAHPEHLVIDAAHVLAAGLWLGMLPLLWWNIDRAVTTAAPGDEQLAASATRRFAVPGATAVITLAVTGVLNAWWLVGSPGNLLASGYGRLVLWKVSLYLAMVLLALVNRFVLVQRLGADTRGTLRALRRTVLAEIGLGVLVLATVAVLGVTPPAAHEHSRHPMHHEM